MKHLELIPGVAYDLGNGIVLDKDVVLDIHQISYLTVNQKYIIFAHTFANINARNQHKEPLHKFTTELTAVQAAAINAFTIDNGKIEITDNGLIGFLEMENPTQKGEKLKERFQIPS